MTWAVLIERSINQLKGVECGQIYFIGNHFTVPVKIKAEAFVNSSMDRLQGLIKAKIQQEIPLDYTYDIAYNISTKS